MSQEPSVGAMVPVMKDVMVVREDATTPTSLTTITPLHCDGLFQFRHGHSVTPPARLRGTFAILHG